MISWLVEQYTDSSVRIKRNLNINLEKVILGEENGINVFVLTLPNSTRYPSCKESLASQGISFWKVEGIYGKDNLVLNDDKSTFLSRFISRPTLGCALSHLKIWEHISNNVNEDDLNIIIEDDTSVDFSKVLALRDELVKYSSLDGSGIIQMTGNTYFKKGSIPLSLEGYSLSNYKFHVMLGAYIVSKKSAEVLYKKIYANYHIDYLINTVSLVNMIVEPPIARQMGWSESNISSQGNRKILKLDDTVNYSMGVPMMKIPIFNVIICVATLFFFLVLVIFYIFRPEPVLWIIPGVLFFELLVLES